MLSMFRDANRRTRRSPSHLHRQAWGLEFVKPFLAPVLQPSALQRSSLDYVQKAGDLQLHLCRQLSHLRLNPGHGRLVLGPSEPLSPAPRRSQTASRLSPFRLACPRLGFQDAFECHDVEQRRHPCLYPRHQPEGQANEPAECCFKPSLFKTSPSKGRCAFFLNPCIVVRPDAGEVTT